MKSTGDIERYLERGAYLPGQSFENVIKAKRAAGDGAHVAALFYYRDAIDTAIDAMPRASLLYLAVSHAENLKKPADRVAVAEWGERVLQTIPSATDSIDRLFGTQPPTMDLAGRISEAISTLKSAGK